MAEYAEVKMIDGVDFGRVASTYTGDFVPPSIGKTIYVDIAGVTPVPQSNWYYSPTLDQFSETPFSALPAPSIAVYPYDFWYERVTNDERGKIFALSQQDGGGFTLDQIQRGRLQALLAFTTANSFNLDNAELVFIFNSLENIGVLDPGRADEILT